MIRLYPIIPENFVYLIFLDGFWIVHIPFVLMVKFKLFAQFSVDHLALLVISSLNLFFFALISYSYLLYN